MLSPHPAINTMSIVEQQAYLEYIEKSKKEQMQLNAIANNAKKELQEFDMKNYSSRASKIEERKKLQKYLQTQIENKKKSLVNTIESTKANYNSTLIALPSDQACIFPKIKTESPHDKLITKKLKQQVHCNHLNNQVKIKQNNNQETENEINTERNIIDKAKEILDKELALKRKLEKEKQLAYKTELDRMVQEKNKLNQKDPAYSASLPIGEENKDATDEPTTLNPEIPKEENEDELLIIDQYFKQANLDPKEPVQKTQSALEIHTNNEQPKDIESAKVSTPKNITKEKQLLLKKLEDYAKRKKQGKSTYISLEKLKEIAIKNSTATKIIKPIKENLHARTKNHSVKPRMAINEVAPATQRERIERSNDIVKAIMRSDMIKPSVTAPENAIEQQIVSDKKRLKKLRLIREMRNSLQNQLKEKDMRKMQEKLLNNAPDIQGTFGYPPLHASSTSNSNKNTFGSQKSQNVIAWEEQMRIKKQKLNKEKNDDELLRQRYEKECLEQRNMEISAKISNSQNSKKYTDMWDLQNKLSVINKNAYGDAPERSSVFMTEPHMGEQILKQ